MKTAARKLRILAPYMFAYGGGVRRVLGDGLPRLAQRPGLSIEYAELCCNEADLEIMERAGVTVDRELGVPGRGILSTHRGFRRGIDLAAAVPRLSRIVWRLRAAAARYHVFYVHGYRELLLSAVAISTIPKDRRPAIVWHCHGIDNGRPPAGVRPLAGRCRSIVAVSDDVVHRLRELAVPCPDVVRIHNAVDIGTLQRNAAHGMGNLPEKRPGQRTLLMACASLRVGKGVDAAIVALRYLPSSFVLWITGELADPVAVQFKRELDRQIDKHGLHSRVFFLDARSDIHAVMKAADLVLVPSRVRESFGFAAAEPMALGVPVAVSNRGALPEVVDHGRCGLVFNPDHVITIADCVRQAFDDPQATAARVANGLGRTEQFFGYDRWVNEVVAVLQAAASQVHTVPSLVFPHPDFLRAEESDPTERRCA